MLPFPSVGMFPRPSCQVISGLTAFPSPSRYTMPCICPVRPMTPISSCPDRMESRRSAAARTIRSGDWMRAQGLDESRKPGFGTVRERRTRSVCASMTTALMLVVPISIAAAFMPCLLAESNFQDSDFLPPFRRQPLSPVKEKRLPDARINDSSQKVQ